MEKNEIHFMKYKFSHGLKFFEVIKKVCKRIFTN
jgi:hypothetical protein